MAYKTIFDVVQKRGKQTGSKFLSIRWLPNKTEDFRCAYAISTKTGNAVTRNHTRRRLREIVRALPARPGFNIVISVRREAFDQTFADLTEDTQLLLSKAKLLEK